MTRFDHLVAKKAESSFPLHFQMDVQIQIMRSLLCCFIVNWLEAVTFYFRTCCIIVN